MFPRILTSLVLTLIIALPAKAEIVCRNSSGANSSIIQPTIDQFRTDLGGVNNGVGVSSTTTGRREINWDGVPNGFSAPNTLPESFFNANSQRGLQLSVTGTTSGFMVSDNASTGNNVGIEFANLNASYPAQFSTHSAQKLFTSLGGNTFDVTFFVPISGTTPATTAAEVSGFGAVFVDADFGGTSSLQFFDSQDVSLVGSAVSPAAQGLSFFGCFQNDVNGPKIARVRVSNGTAAIGPDDSPTSPNFRDIVVNDDFIYGEPTARVIVFKNGFE